MIHIKHMIHMKHIKHTPVSVYVCVYVCVFSLTFPLVTATQLTHKAQTEAQAHTHIRTQTQAQTQTQTHRHRHYPRTGQRRQIHPLPSGTQARAPCGEIPRTRTCSVCTGV